VNHNVAMSGLAPIAAVMFLGPTPRVGLNVRFGGDTTLLSDVRFTSRSGHRTAIPACPLSAKSGLTQCSRFLFDHLIGAQHEPRRDLVIDRLRGLEINDQFKSGGLLDWKISRLRAAQQLGELAAQNVPVELND
jgi:hypothetical protein